MYGYRLFIARRYLFSRKSTHAINIISAISAVGVAVATIALVVTLSVFNGFRDTLVSFFTQFDPQLKIVPVTGKTVPADDPLLDKVRQLKAVDIATDIVEDQALAIYGDRQAMVRIKGVDDNFSELTHINELLIGDGQFELHAGNLQYVVPGIEVAIKLGLGTRFQGFLRVYAPEREGQFDPLMAHEAFVADSLMSAGVVFQVKQSRYDANYMLVPIGFARNLFAQQGMVSALELRLKPDADFDKTKKEIEKILNGKYDVLDRYEQQAETYQIMNIEKLLAYVFLTFILIVACFNIIGSLSMLMIDKKKDAKTLQSIGAKDKDIARIFLYEGLLISFIGAIVGIAIGVLLCWLQKEYGLIRLGNSQGYFYLNAYPVSVHLADIITIFVTVIVVSWLSVWYPVKYMTRQMLTIAKT